MPKDLFGWMQAGSLRRIVVSIVFLVVAVGCSGGIEDAVETANTADMITTAITAPQPTQVVATLDSPTPVPEVLPTPLPAVLAPTPTPKVIPSPTSTPTATPAEIPKIDVPDIALALADPSECRIAGELGWTGLSGQGTAPAPTPTQIPPTDTRIFEVIQPELRELGGEMASLLSGISDSDSRFNDGWRHADTLEEQAGQLHIYGNRLGQFCSSISLVSIPIEAHAGILILSDALRAKHLWVSLAFEELHCCGDAQTELMSVGHRSTSKSIRTAVEGLTDLFDEYLIDLENLGEREITSERFGLTMTLPTEAILVRNSVDQLVVFLDHDQYLNPKSLGFEGWVNGTGIRLKRIRNIRPISIEQAAEANVGLIDKYGEAVQITGSDLSEIQSLRYAYLALEDDWSGSITLFILGDFTYFVEMMCDQANPDLCELMEQTLQSLLPIAS